MLVGLAWLVFAVWVWLLVGRGWFWWSGPVLRDRQPVRGGLRVTAVVPARDEAEHVVAMLDSLLAQRFAGELRVLLVDDNSRDGTGDLARAVAARDGRVRVIAGAPLEPGWTGKLWAVAQGLREPEARVAEYVLLTDGDIVHGPDHVALLTAKAEGEGLELVSEMVRLRCRSLAERATIPAFVFFFQMLYPFRWVGDARRRTAAAAGGTMLVARRALDRIGGVDRMGGELIDDVALARAVKRGGHGIWLGHGEEAESGRRYAGFGEVWRMVARTAYVQLGYSPGLLAGTCVGLLLVYGGPVGFAVTGEGVVRWLGVASWGMMAVALQPTLRRYRCSPLWGIALPAMAMFYFAATCGSAVEFYRGRGGAWKDRTYARRG